jgi:exosortase
LSATLQASAGWRQRVALLTSDRRVFLACLALLLAHVPLLLLHVRSLSEWSDYQFFPYAILVALFLAIRAVQGVDLSKPRLARPLACYTLLICSWLMLAFGLFVISSPRAGALALISTGAAVTLAFGETALLRRLLPAILVFCMIIPLPWNLDQTLVSNLQSLTATESGQILDMLGVPNIVQAHSVKLPAHNLQVEEGCSGINSLFTILITALLYVCWMKRPFIQSVLLLLSALGAMLVANILRVVAVGYFLENFHWDLSFGWRHEALGLFLFGLALLLVGSMDQFLIWAAYFFPKFGWSWLKMRVTRLFHRRKKPAPAVEELSPAPVSIGSAPCFSMPVAVAFGALVIAQMAWLVPTRFDTRSDSDLIDRGNALVFERVSAGCSGWEALGGDKVVRERSSPFGRFSDFADFKVGNQLGKLELDYPFFGWHNLTNCYALRGWEVRSTKVVETELPGQQPGNTVIQSLTRGVDEHAFLLYSSHDSDGRLLKRPGKYPGRSWLQAHLLSPRGLNVHLCALFHIDIGEQQVFSAEPEWYMPTLQMQLLVQGLSTLDEKEMARARANFDHARSLLMQELSRDSEKKQ